MYYIFKFMRWWSGGTSWTHSKNGERLRDESLFIFTKNGRDYRITLSDLGPTNNGNDND